MINCNDQERLDEAIEMLVDQTNMAKSRGNITFLGIFLGHQDLLEPASSLVFDVERKVTEAIVNRAKPQFPWTIYTQPGLSATTGDHISEVLENLIENSESGKNLAWKGRDEELWTMESYTEKLRVPCNNGNPSPLLDRGFVERMKADLLNDIDSGPLACSDNFLELARDMLITDWDHRAQLRAMFLLLVPNLTSQTEDDYPMSAVLRTIAQYLAFLAELRLIDEHDRYKIVISRTMATFHVYQIYLAFIKLIEVDQSLKGTRTIQMANFRRLLYYNPQLQNPHLWATYYSTEKFTSGIAHKNWVLPDLTTLPQLPLPYNITEPLPDNIRADSLSSSQHADDTSNAMLRQWAFSILKKVKTTGERRGKSLPKALEALKRDTIAARIVDSSLHHYSETQAYFWIQITHLAIDRLEKDEKNFDVTKMSYSTFALLYPDALGRGRVWPEYYSEDLWRSVKARMIFHSPDKGKIVPNVSIAKPDTGVLDWRPILETKVPSCNQLNEMKEAILKDVKDTTSEKSGFVGIQTQGGQELDGILENNDNTGTQTPIDNVDDEEWEMLGLPPSTLIESPEGKEEDNNTSRNMDYSNIEKILEKKLSMIPSCDITSGKPEKETKSNPELTIWPAPSPVSHAKLIYALFEHARQKSPPENDKTLSKIPVNTRVFWTRRIADAFYESYTLRRRSNHVSDSKDNDDEDDDQPKYDFITFLSDHPGLAWDGLWRLYYTELTWYSHDAEQRVLRRDRLEIKSILKELKNFKFLWIDPV